jgi:peptidoglycan-associated lipoprotein
MTRASRLLRAFGLVTMLAASLVVSACANKTDQVGAELTPQARATLDAQIQWLQRYNHYTFTLEGHADERGTREYNIALGARRAQTVREYMASRGISPQRMRTISYGKERPVAVCDNISCWSQNRRVVTVLNASS